ncbi:hypothetical protein LXL04_032615 [Taraxacum kok-saghyz]
MMQLGAGFSPRRMFSAGCSSISMAAYILGKRSNDGIMSKFSHPSGKPTSDNESWSSRSSILRLASIARAMAGRTRLAFTGVVIIVTVAPRWARIRAMSTMGIIWPCCIRGNKTKGEQTQTETEKPKKKPTKPKPNNRNRA